MDKEGEEAFVEFFDAPAKESLTSWGAFLDDEDDDVINTTCQGISQIAHGVRHSCEKACEKLVSAGLGEKVFDVVHREYMRRRQTGSKKEARQDLQRSSLLALSNLVQRRFAFTVSFKDQLLTHTSNRESVIAVIVWLLDKRHAVPAVMKLLWVASHLHGSFMASQSKESGTKATLEAARTTQASSITRSGSSEQSQVPHS